MLPFIIIVVALSLAASDVRAQEEDGESTYVAPYTRPDSDAVLEGDYIVTFHCGYNISAHSDYLGFDMNATNRYLDMSWMPGYRALFDDETLADVRSDPGVKGVEHNLAVGLIDEVNDIEQGGNEEADTLDLDAEDTSPDASRIRRRFTTTVIDGSPYGQRQVWAHASTEDERDEQEDEEEFEEEYDEAEYDEEEYDEEEVEEEDDNTVEGPRTILADAGKDATVWVFDKGVRITHRGFQGRASHFRGLFNSPYLDESEPMDDFDGHGTRMAGIAAGYRYGTAPFANVINVKVLPTKGRGTSAHITQALHDVTEDHKALLGTEGYRGGVINMSLGFPDISKITDLGALKRALDEAYDSGLLLVAGAGNNNQPADEFYPCAYDKVLCVAATGGKHWRFWFSNYGRKVNIYAPGESIVSFSHESDLALTKPEDGTSDATAHVSGVGLVYNSHESLRDRRMPIEYDDGSTRYLLVAHARILFNALRGVVRTIHSGDRIGVNLFANVGMGRGLRSDQPYWMESRPRGTDEGWVARAGLGAGVKR